MKSHRAMFVLLGLTVPQLSVLAACDPDEPVEVEADEGTGGIEAMAVADSQPRQRAHRKGGKHGSIEDRFKAWDKDGDGKVALSALPEHKRARLAAADADHDGSITVQELKIAREQHRKAMDTDGDGVLSNEERRAAHEARHQARLAAIDTDGDGTVSEQEKAAARARRVEAKFNHGDQNGDGRIDAEEAGERWSWLSAADSDNDGGVTKEELERAMANRELRGHRGKRHGRGKHLKGKGTGPGKDAPTR